MPAQIARLRKQKNWVFGPWLAQLDSLLPCLVWHRSAKLASVRMSLALHGSGWPGVSWPCSAQVATAQLVRGAVWNLSQLVQAARLQGGLRLFLFQGYANSVLKGPSPFIYMPQHGWTSKWTDGCLIRPLWSSKAGPAKGSYPRLDTFLCMAV